MLADTNFDVRSPMPRAAQPPKVSYTSPFAIGDRVHVGDDDATVATVTAILWRVEAPQIEVSWMHNGALQCVWAAPMMLRPA